MTYRNKCIGGGTQCQRMFLSEYPLPDSATPICENCAWDMYRGTIQREIRTAKEAEYAISS